MTDLLCDYEAHLRRLRRSPRTITDYLGVLRRMENELPCGVATATTEELEAWIFAGKRSETTYGHYVTIARQFGRWATDRRDQRLEWHASDELPNVRAQSKEIRPAAEGEWQDILARAQRPWIDMYDLAGRAGLRSIEIARIRREDLTEKTLRIFGKGSKWRTVPTHPALWERFQDRGPGLLTLDPYGEPMTSPQVVQRGRYYLHRLGLDLSMHSLRKRYAMRIYEESGHDIRLVQHLLGHRYVSTTQRYLGVDGERAAEVTNRID